MYALGHAATVACRPLILFLANNRASEAATDALAVVMLANTIGMTSIAVDPHRRFYQRHFSDSFTANALPYLLYTATIAPMLLIGSAVTLGVAGYLTDSLTVAFAAALYFASEKLADEVGRYQLFAENLKQWGYNGLLKAAIQLGGTAFLIMLLGNAVTVLHLVAVLAVANLIVFVPQVPAVTFRSLHKVRLTPWLLRRAALWVRHNWLLWVLAIMTSGVTYLDRVFAVILDRRVFPVFMLVSMCLSVVPTIVSSYYVNRHRKDFLRNRVTVRGVLLNGEFLLVASSGVLFGLVLTGVMLSRSNDGGDFPVGYIVAIAMMQVLLALILVVREILYWQGGIAYMIRLEAAFYGLLICGVFAGVVAGLHTIAILGIVVISLAIRLWMYLKGTQQSISRLKVATEVRA